MKRKIKSKLAALLVICMCFPMSATARYTDRETYINDTKAGILDVDLDLTEEYELLNGTNTNNISLMSLKSDKNNDFEFVDEQDELTYPDQDTVLNLIFEGDANRTATQSNIIKTQFLEKNNIATPSNVQKSDTSLLNDSGFDFKIEIVEINEVNFPDNNFRDDIKILDQDHDGWLSQDEIESNNGTYIIASDISDFTGIEYLTALEILDCNYCDLTELNLSNNTNLIELDCKNCGLTELDLSNNKNLETIDCSGNNLISLDISGLEKLNTLYCYSNELENIVFDENFELENFSCANNKLTELDLTALNLSTLICFNNNIKTLDISGSTNLSSLNIKDNPLYLITFPDNNNIYDMGSVFNDDTWYNYSDDSEINNISITAEGQTIYKLIKVKFPLTYYTENNGSCVASYIKNIFNFDFSEGYCKSYYAYLVGSNDIYDYENYIESEDDLIRTSIAESGKYHTGFKFSAISKNVDPYSIDKTDLIFVFNYKPEKNSDGQIINLSVIADQEACTYSDSSIVSEYGFYIKNDTKTVVDNFIKEF